MKKRKRNMIEDQAFGTGFKDQKESLNNEREKAKKASHYAAEEARRAKLAAERLKKKQSQVLKNE